MSKAAFDFETLTLGEVAFIENMSERSISEISDDGAPVGKSLAAIVTVIKRRSGEPGYKFNQALGLSLTEASAYLQSDDEEEGVDAGEDDAFDANEQS